MIKKLMMLTAVAAVALGAWADTAVVGDYTWTYTRSGSTATITKVSPELSGYVTIPSKLNGYNVTAIGGYAFTTSLNLNSVTIPNGVTSIGEMAFATCPNLTSVNMPNTVTSIGNQAFGLCMSLASVKIPNSVTSIGEQAFYECVKLNSITIPDGVTEIKASAFHGCSSLASVKISANVTSIRTKAFHKCSSLTSVTIPDKVTSIGSQAFYKCGNLKYVTMGRLVNNIGDKAFQGCTSLIHVAFYGGAPEPVGTDAFLNCREGCMALAGWSSYNNGDNWHGLTVKKNSPSWQITNGVLTKAVLYGNSNVVIPDSVEIIGTNVFEESYSLEHVTIPSTVTSIRSHAFSRCTGLKNIEIPESVTNIGYMAFYDCSALTSLKIPDSVTNLGGYAFSFCTNLTSVTLPQAAFNRSYRWENELFQVRSTSDNKITDVVISDGVTSIGESIFLNFYNLKNVVIPNSVTNIKDSAFYDCKSLSSVTIPDGVRDIGSSAFKCSSGSSLVEVSIPGNMYYIRSYAFDGCKKLSRVTMRGNCPTYVGTKAFNNVDPDCIVRLPRGNTTYNVVDGKWQGMTVVYYGGSLPKNVGIPDSKGTMEGNADGTYSVTANSGETLSEEDFDFGEIDKDAYKIDIASDGKSATVTLAEPQVDLETEEDKVADDPTGVLVDVDESEIAAKPTPASGEDVGALPVNTHKGLFYQASWGDDVNNLTPGNKVLATGKELNLGVIKQKGAKGFYKISVSEK